MFLKFNNMNQTKRERIQKQLTKLLTKKSNLDKSIDTGYFDMLNYIILQKPYQYYPKINTILNIDDIDIGIGIGIDSDTDSKFDNTEVFKKYLSRLKSITLDDLDDSNLQEIKKEIKYWKDKTLMNEHKKKQMNQEIKKLRTEFANNPANIIKKVLFEKQNLFNVIGRIGNLESNNNNRLIEDYSNIQSKIDNINKSIKQKKLEVSNQYLLIQQMRTQNLEIRNKKVQQIQKFKGQQINILKDRKELINQKEQINKKINEYILDVNTCKEHKKILMQNINEVNLDNTNEKINELNERVRYLLKKVDFFIKEKNRYQQRIQIFNSEKQISNNKEKVVTKLKISNEKAKYNMLLSSIDMMNLKRQELVNEQKEAILNNMKYNEKLNNEYKRSEERILKVVSRINNSFNSDREELQKEINIVLEKIDNENMEKKNNLIKVNELEINITESFKDLNYLRQVLESIINRNKEIEKINIDISSYQKILK
jgi:hypothetical protein